MSSGSSFYCSCPILRLIGALLLVATLVAGPAFSSAAWAEEPAADPPRLTAGADSFFGIAEAYRQPQLAGEAGVRWERVLFFWNTIQPNNAGEWLPNSEISDEQIEAEVEGGRELVGVIGNPPGWATRNGSVPKNLELPVDDEKNYWAGFVRALAGRYAGKIDHWIIWNEPDIDPGNPGSTWAGTEREYYLLLKNAYLAARQANPRAKIIFGGTTFWADSMYNRKLFIERVLEEAAKDPTAAANGFYFDAVALHIYNTVSYIYTTPKYYRDVLRRFGLRKPLWLTETNVVPWDDPVAGIPATHYRVTMQDQASFIIEAMALARAAGFERVAVYKMVDGLAHQKEPYGLVRDDGTPRPAFRAYQVAATYLSVPGRTTYEREGSIAKVTVEVGSRRTTVLWNTRTEPVRARIWPAGTRAWLIEADGRSKALPLPTDPNNLAYDIPLTGAPAANGIEEIGAYVVGGKPVILVEDGIGEGLRTPDGGLYFPVTGFSTSGPFLDFFTHRGGIRTLGYPISRPFKLQGVTVQFFQRQALTLRADGTVGLLNVLDPEFMPYTQINGAIFPSFDSVFLEGSPQPGQEGYAEAALQFVRDNAPDVWEGMPVSFGSTFFNAVHPDEAFPDGRVDHGLLQGFNMELWGLPTSRPARDPKDNNAVYQRFQRGVMRYDGNRGVTEGLLLVDYLKGILMGQGLPADLDAAARESPLYKQYDPSQPKWVSRPDQLPDSDLTQAFEREPAPALENGTP